MTAEVAIMNRIGVALAADSAVTISGGEDEKTYSSADKLFQLSQVAPVGMMIYGNVHFVDIPWETIIKEYRRVLGGKKFATVEQYAENFFKFLGDNRVLFPKSAQDENIRDILMWHYGYIRHLFKDELDVKAEKHGELTQKDITRIISKEVDNFLEIIHENSRLEKISNANVVAIRRKYANYIREIMDDLFGNLPISDATNKKIQSIGIEILCRGIFIPEESGVVFAGFGEREVMPVIYEYKMEGMIQNKPRLLEIGKNKITVDRDAVICPFAQREILDMYIDGIHPERLSYMRDSTEEMFSTTVASIFDIIGKEVPGLREETKQNMRSKVQECVEKLLFHEWEEAKEDYWDTILQMVPSFPKDELASVAEALVDLTKFRERITPGLETVGGPIDVAVITKGDGFVWIKRKQYFDPSLNPRVVA